MVSPGQIFTGTITEFKGVAASGGRGPQISFTATGFNQLAEIDLLRGLTRDPATAKNVIKWSRLSPSAGPDAHTFNDGDPSIIGSKVFYFVEVILTNPDAAPILVGPIQVQA